MALMIPFKNPKTGEIKTVKVGFNWLFLFWSGFLGLPLFSRGLNVWGGLFLGLWAINLLFNFEPDLQIIFVAIATGLSLWIATKGNEMVAKNYLEKGWTFSEPNSEPTKIAKQRWGISIEGPIADSQQASIHLQPIASQIAQGDIKFCFSCGVKIPLAAGFCSACGVSQAQMPNAS